MPPETYFFDEEKQLQSRAVWLSYVENKTQGEIAKQLGTNRLRINRLLLDARQTGLVKVSIHSELTGFFELERRLKSEFSLDEAMVVPTPSTAEEVNFSVGAGLGQFMSRMLLSEEVRTIGYGWGKTLRASVNFTQRMPRRDINIVTLLGSPIRSNEEHSFEIIAQLGNLLQAQRFYLPAPMYANSAETRNILMKQDSFAEYLTHIRNMDIACFATGAITEQSMTIDKAIPRDISAESLLEAGCVGDFLGNFLDAAGNLIDHDINDRLVGPNINILGDIKKLVLASGGLEKAPIILAALRTGLPKICISDEATVKRILELID